MWASSEEGISLLLSVIAWVNISLAFSYQMDKFIESSSTSFNKIIVIFKLNWVFMLQTCICWVQPNEQPVFSALRIPCHCSSYCFHFRTSRLRPFLCSGNKIHCGFYTDKIKHRKRSTNTDAYKWRKMWKLLIRMQI